MILGPVIKLSFAKTVIFKLLLDSHGKKIHPLLKSCKVQYTANNYRHCTAFCGVTFPTVIWRYSELQMAVLRDADGSNCNSLMSSAALSTAKLLSET